MRRRPHGEGVVYQRGEGWVAVLELDPSVDGRRRRRYLDGKTQRDVLDRLASLRTQPARPRPADQRGPRHDPGAVPRLVG